MNFTLLKSKQKVMEAGRAAHVVGIIVNESKLILKRNGSHGTWCQNIYNIIYLPHKNCESDPVHCRRDPNENCLIRGVNVGNCIDCSQ